MAPTSTFASVSSKSKIRVFCSIEAKIKFLNMKVIWWFFLTGGSFGEFSLFYIDVQSHRPHCASEAGEPRGVVEAGHELVQTSLCGLIRRKSAELMICLHIASVMGCWTGCCDGNRVLKLGMRLVVRVWGLSLDWRLHLILHGLLVVESRALASW